MINNKLKREPILTVLKKISEGQICAKKLDQKVRWSCVEYLYFHKGCSSFEIAHVLKVSDRTIRRDLVRIRRRKAIKFDGDFVSKSMGEAQQKKRLHWSKLKHMAESKDLSPSEKANAEFMAWRVEREWIGIVVKIMAVALKPNEIVANEDKIKKIVVQIVGGHIQRKCQNKQG